MTLVHFGIPAGVEVDFNKLEHEVLAGVYAKYEIRDSEVVLYIRGLAPKEEKIITIDTIARTAGKYTGIASHAYLYYMSESKYWVPPVDLEVY